MTFYEVKESAAKYIKIIFKLLKRFQHLMLTLKLVMKKKRFICVNHNYFTVHRATLLKTAWLLVIDLAIIYLVFSCLHKIHKDDVQYEITPSV